MFFGFTQHIISFEKTIQQFFWTSTSTNLSLFPLFFLSFVIPGFFFALPKMLDHGVIHEREAFHHLESGAKQHRWLSSCHPDQHLGCPENRPSASERNQPSMFRCKLAVSFREGWIFFLFPSSGEAPNIDLDTLDVAPRMLGKPPG